MNFHVPYLNPTSRRRFSRLSTWAVLILTLVPLLSLWPTAVAAVAEATGEKVEMPDEELVIFVQPSADGAITEQLEAEHLPAIRQTADALGISVRVLDAAEGVPETVRITPLLVYQSARGRAFFQGRYTDPGKVKHFLRTSRAIPALSEALHKERVAVKTLGRSRVYAPIKITDPAGELPSGVEPADFKRRVLAAVEAGFESFELEDQMAFGPADRAFYMDFYPYVSKDGKLFVSVALFSQFDCIDAVYRSSEAIGGSVDSLEDVFARAVRSLEAEVTRQVQGSTLGDGFDPVPADVATRTWQDLDLELPKLEGSIDPAAADRPLSEWPRQWRLADPDADVPRLIFRFPSPLERYSGEVSALQGRLELSESGELRPTAGFMEAVTASVTMGESSLDQAIHRKMIYIADFPTSRFTVDRFTADTEALAFGRPTRLGAEGSFTMMGKTVPVLVRGDVEPVVGPDGEPRLRVRAAFELKLSIPFGIAGPDGPEPARDTLKFFLDFHMEADPQTAS